ncbi:hypothetical protein N7471_008213 [Penicillium samsonianum]|uniref:uncharacterized protein n=1 Tax=Penicillium samsonianum TaxID=1882272 RepID=UPI002548C6EF|nr:uncharacterized protein N7471_008213 [Penicillium samsonianum]KAJ6132998.1 hypothetical protein N7471_008213 [Penicillium samsonianum]
MSVVLMRDMCRFTSAASNVNTSSENKSKDKDNTNGGFGSKHNIDKVGPLGIGTPARLPAAPTTKEVETRSPS